MDKFFKTYGVAPLSIRKKLFLLRIGIGLFMGLVIGTASVWISAKILNNFLVKDLGSSAHLVSGQIQQTINHIGGELTDMAESDEMEKYYQSHRNVILTGLFRKYSDIFDTIAYVNFQGLTETSITHGKVDNGALAADTSKGFGLALETVNTMIIDGPVYDPGIEKPVLRFYYHHIDYFDNQDGLLRASMSLDAFGRHLERIFQKEKRHSILLLDQGSQIIFGPRPEDFGKPAAVSLGTAVFEDKVQDDIGFIGTHPVYGDPSLVAVSPLLYPEWNAYIIKSATTIRTLLYTLFGLIFLVTLTALLVGDFFSRRIGIKITEPIERLTRVTSDILRSGNLDQRVEWDSKDEMGELADLFNSMLGKINTKQHQIQEERARELEREIAKRKKDQERLRIAISEAQTATKAKSEFLTNMSHEIRTPMNGIMGMAELALDTELDKNQESLITTISTESESLLAIINSILDFSKIEAGKLDLDLIPFNLRDLFEDLSTTFAITAQKKGLEFISFFPPDLYEHLIGDPVRLRQILVNLVGNALKFTHTGEVYMAVNQNKDLGESIQLGFSIKDTGIGIVAEHQEKIFDSFSQADGSTTRQYGGTGLGTTISKQLVELMGGTMGLESKPLSGSTFWFTITLKKDPAQTCSKAPSDLLKGLKVMVVDDNKNNRFVLSQYLISFGCTPIRAHDGPQALEILSGQTRDEPNPIQLILSDYQMPKMDGVQLARQIKALPLECQAPIMMLTSIGSLPDLGTPGESGIIGCLSKPIRRKELKTAFSSILVHGSPDKESSQSPRALPPADRPRKTRILLAEDYPTNQKIVIKHLTGSGFQVILAENGQQAVDLFRQDQFDLVLMDIQMPVLDGYEATKKIRHQEAENRKKGSFKRTPIIAVTAHAIKGYRETCLEAGMDDYIAKPLKKKDLIHLVEKWTLGQTLGQTTDNRNLENYG